MSKLDISLLIGRATFERWLGTEPIEIAAAAELLRDLEPEHPSLGDLEERLRRAQLSKAMLDEVLHSDLAPEDDEDWRRL